MRKPFIIYTFFALSFIVIFFMGFQYVSRIETGAPPYEAEDLNPPSDNIYSEFLNWKRPEGPPKVAIQAGHWKSAEAPEELKRLRDNTGASGGGKWEWELNLEIARETAAILREKGITVDILPATIPPRYWADVFVAIHADGSLDTSKTGFKIASPRRNFNGKAEKLRDILYEEYEQATGLGRDDNITRNMRGYYAFAWWRHEHALHPMTTAVILETGFLTSSADRKVLFNTVVPARGIASGILKYLKNEKVLVGTE